MSEDKEYKGKLYNLGPGTIGTARPGQLIKETLTKADAEKLKAAGLVSETPQEKASGDEDNKLKAEISELKGRLVEKDETIKKLEAKPKEAVDAIMIEVEKEKKEYEKTISELNDKIKSLTADNAELKKLAGGK